MKTEVMTDYRVLVVFSGEVKTYDVRNISSEQCKKDFIQGFKDFIINDIKVTKIPSLEFKRS